MKRELTIEEKAKAYDEAKARMNRAFNSNRCTIGFMNEIFPEFAKNEDERIRKECISIIKAWDKSCRLSGDYCESASTCIAWLERQGEHKLVDKVEEKFRVGDWIMDKQGIIHKITDIIEDVNNHTYIYNIDGVGYCNNTEEGVRLWTIEDAKDGDVLYMKNGLSTSIFIYKSIDNVVIQKYASYNKFGFEGRSYLVLNDGYVCPATKKQRDLLFQKMKKAGYKWDVNKKELKKNK